VQFDNSSGEIVGSFVRLTAPQDGAILRNFSSEGTALIDAVAVTGYTKDNESFVGSLFKVYGSVAEADVHDNPNALIKVTLDAGATASYDLAQGVSASPGNNSTSLFISVAGSNRTAVVWWTCGASSMTLAGGGGSFDVAAASLCHVFFRSHIEGTADEEAIAQAAQGGLLMAEVYVGTGSEDGSDVGSYGDTSVVVTHTPNGVLVSLGAEGNRPSSVVIRFVPGHNGGPVVLVDGQAVRPASSLGDALDPSNDGAAIEYAMVPSADGNALLVISLPDAASHVVQIQTSSVSVARDVAPALAGVALALLVVAGATAVLFRRR
jgi:hypothetical protein